jgi:hypothetical protein
MKKNSTFLAFFVLIAFSSCHRYFTSASFAEKAARHKTVAILPPQVVFTGNLPKGVSATTIAETEEKESMLFQEALYSNVLKRGNGRKQILGVNVQPNNNTLATLKANGISLRESWTMTDIELAKVLGVDAVVRTLIQKDRLMSDLASAGIDYGKRVIERVISGPGTLALPGTKTNDIRATCSIISNGETLWSDSYTKGSDWNSPANTIINSITDNFAKHFPYRKQV